MNNLFMHLCTICDSCDAVVHNGDTIMVSCAQLSCSGILPWSALVYCSWNSRTWILLGRQCSYNVHVAWRVVVWVGPKLTCMKVQKFLESLSWRWWCSYVNLYLELLERKIQAIMPPFISDTSENFVQNSWPESTLKQVISQIGAQ